MSFLAAGVMPPRFFDLAEAEIGALAAADPFVLFRLAQRAFIASDSLRRPAGVRP